MAWIFGRESYAERRYREAQRLRDIGSAIEGQRYEEGLQAFRRVEQRLQPGFLQSFGRSYFQRLVEEGRSPESARSETLQDLGPQGRFRSLAVAEAPVPGSPQFEEHGRMPSPERQVEIRNRAGPTRFAGAQSRLIEQAKRDLIEEGINPRHVDWVLQSMAQYHQAREQQERAGGMTEEEIEDYAFRTSGLKAALATAGPKPSALERGMGYFAEAPSIKALSAVLETGGGLLWQTVGPPPAVAEPLGLKPAPLPFEEDPRKTFHEQPRAVQIGLESALFAPLFGPGMAASMGVGAIGGRELAKATGVPPMIGELTGFVGGPLALGGVKGLYGVTRAGASVELSAARTNLAVSKSVLARAEEMGNTALAAEARQGVTIFEGQVARLEGRALVAEPTGPTMGRGAPTTVPPPAVAGALTAEQLGAKPPAAAPTQAEIAAGVTAPRPGTAAAEIAAEPGIPRTVMAPGGPQPPSILATRWSFEPGAVARRLWTGEAGGIRKPTPEVVRPVLDTLKEPPGPASGEVPTPFAFERRTVRVGDLEFQPERFQARDADPGLPYSEARVARLVDVFDPAQYTPPHAVRDPQTGRLIVYRGHHRLEAFKRKYGEDANTEVIVSGADISDPAQFQSIQMEGLASNFKTAEANFRERVRAVAMADEAGLDELEVAQRLGMTTKTTQDLRDAGRLGPGVVDQIAADNTMGPLAAEIGKGMRVYGISQEEAVGLFNRLLQAPKGQRPTPGGLAETIKKFGSKLKQVSTEAMSGFEVAADSRGGLLAALDEHAKLETALMRQQGRIKRTQSMIRELMENPLATPDEVKGLRAGLGAAERVQADIERQITTAADDVGRAFRQVGQDAKGGMFAQAERPAEAISSAERVVPEIITSEMVGPGRVQPLPSQVSEAAFTPSPTTRATTPPARPVGPTRTLNELGISVESWETTAPKPILAQVETLEEGLQAAANIRDKILLAYREIAPDNFYGVRVKGSLERLREKMIGGRTPAQVSDYLGGRFIGTEEELDGILRALQQRFKITQGRVVRGQAERPDAVTLDVNVGEAITVETQLLTPEMAVMQQRVHKLYEVFRSPTASQAKVEAALAETKALLARTPPAGTIDVATARRLVAQAAKGEFAEIDRLLLPPGEVGQMGFTPAGEVVARPTYATEAELSYGARETQARMAEDAPPMGGRAPRTTEASVGQQSRFDFPDVESGVIEPPRRPPEPPPPSDGPPPGVSDGMGGGPVEGPTGLLARFMDRLPGRPIRQSDWAKYTGGLSLEAREIQLARETLNSTGRKVPRIGRNIMSRNRNPDSEAMFEALHGEGPIPKGAEGLYDDLQKFLRLHEERTLVDVASFERSLLPQYFPRSWRNGEAKVAEYRLGQALERGEITQAKFVEEHTILVRSGRLGPGAKPGTLRHRTLPMSFKEAVAEGWEPVSWNPADMVALHAADLAEWRFSSVLADLWKQETRAIPKSAAPSNWETPPYPAFESRPFVTKEGGIGWSEPLVVAKEDAQALQHILGRAPTDITDVGAYITSVFKRSKVMASYFQHLDLSVRVVNRALTRAATGNVRDLQLLAAGPKAMAANFIPPLRRKLWDALIRDPEVALGMEEGLQLTAGLDVFKRSVMSALEPDLVLRAPFIGDIPMQRVPLAVRTKMKPLVDGMDSLYRYFAEGLFDGAAPQYIGAFYKSLNKELASAHPELNARQVAALAADRTNMMMSNIPEWQSALGPRLRQAGRATLFSVNETEAWTRQIWSLAFKGNLPGTRGLLARQWAGYIFGTLAFAELFNYAITGELLTEDQLSPITLKDDDGNWSRPRYNTRFARPRLDGDGFLGKLLGLKGGAILGPDGKPTGDYRHIYLDLLGQADNPFRMFSPEFFIMTRLAPQWTTALQQYKGERFFGERPFASVQERLGFTAAQLFQPISTVSLTGEEKDRIGLAGAMIQAVGFNVSAERLGELKQRAFEEEGPAALEDLQAGEVEPWEYSGESPLDRWLTEENGRLSAIRDEGRNIGIELGSPQAIAAEKMRQLIQGEEEKGGGMADLAKAVMGGDPVAAGQWSDRRGSHLTWRSGVYDNAEAQFGWPEPELEIGKLSRQYYTADPYAPQFLDAHQRPDWVRFDAYREGIKDEIRKLPRGEWEVMAMEENDKFKGELTEVVDREWRGASDLKELYYEIPKYADLNVAESDIIDGLEAQVKVQALKIASLTGNPEVDTKPLWRDAIKGQSPKIQRWVLKYIVRGEGDSYYKQMMKSAIKNKVRAGPGRDLVMSLLGIGEAGPNPLNPDRLLFKAQYIDILNFWFPDQFPLSRELAATAPIPTQLIEATAAS